MDVEQLRAQLAVDHEVWRDEVWTVFHVPAHPFARSRHDWGPAYLYAFHDVGLARRWHALNAAIDAALARAPVLAQLVERVPFAAAGGDFVLQAKPPYDGGYSTLMYEEFLQHGSCRPNEDLLASLAALHAAFVQDVGWRAALERTNEGLVVRILHATLVRPNGALFWGGDATWTLYYPIITRDDLEAWQLADGA